MVHHKSWLAVAAVAVIGLVAPASAREVVRYDGEGQPGTIVVKTAERRLYFVLGEGRAIRYPVAVGRVGKQWQGRSWVRGKHVNPAWSPPAEVRADNPKLPAVIPGGSPHNPMGPRALTLLWGEYAIHGTNKPSSIGTFASYGCIRMYNQDILDLFGRVSVGTPVVVTPGTAEAPSRPHGAAIPAVTLTDMSKSHSDRRARPNAEGPHSRSVQQAIQETKRAIERSIGKLFGRCASPAEWRHADRSNLPRDPATGHIKGGPGRRKGQPNVVSRLAKDKIKKVFEALGGVQGMYEWAMRSERNKRDFYMQILPRLLGAETADAVAEKIANRPRITRIETAIIDPRDDYMEVLDAVPYRGVRTGDRRPGGGVL